MRSIVVLAICAAALVSLPAAGAATPLRVLTVSADVSLDRLGDTGSDPAVLLLDTIAYAADVLSFYQEQVANEAFLGTSRGDRLTLAFASSLGDFTVHCVVSDVAAGVGSGPCAAHGAVAGPGRWAGAVDRTARRLSFVLALDVICLRCPTAD